MATAEAIALAARFIGGTEDSTDLMQDVEDFLKQEIDGRLANREDEIDTLTPQVTAVVSTALTELAAGLELKATRMLEVRTANERRVRAVLEQFPLHYDELDIDIGELTDALYGVRGVIANG